MSEQRQLAKVKVMDDGITVLCEGDEPENDRIECVKLVSSARPTSTDSFLAIVSCSFTDFKATRETHGRKDAKAQNPVSDQTRYIGQLISFQTTSRMHGS